jgi:phosphatidylglycerophosphate synthase
MATFFCKVSIRLSYVLAHTSVTPNQVTLMSALVAFLAATLVQSSTYWIRLVGVVVWFMGYILDICDGDIARYRNMKSEFGHWFEAVSDRAKDLALLAGITLLAFNQIQASWVIWVGSLALGGTILHAYASSYGFKASKPSSSGSLAKFGQLHYVLLAVFMVLNYVQVYLVIVALTSLSAVAFDVYFTWKKSRTRINR